MRERIILAPGVNASELPQNLAMHGVNCFNLRIVGAGELARIALMRSGIPVREDFVSVREETALVAKAVKAETYFVKPTYSDIKEIAGVIRRMRSLVPDGNEEERIEKTLQKGAFAEKNKALLSVYRKFRKNLSDENLIDSISLIRKAITDADEIDADFFFLKQYPLSPLEKALLDKLSGKRAKEGDLADLFGVTKETVRIDSYKNCYGAPNEVETILADIYVSKNLDKCTVAVTDTATYGQLFFDYALLYDMPITFGCGIPIINSNPAKLLVLYYQWMTSGFFGSYAISSMLCSEAFDGKKLKEQYPKPGADFHYGVYVEMYSALRLTNQEAVNRKRLDDLKQALAEEEARTDPNDARAVKTIRQKKAALPYLEVLAKELALPAEEFIYKYSYIRKGSATNAQQLLMMLDLAAAGVIYDELSVIRKAGLEQATEDMLMNVLRLGVANARSEEGKLFVTGIEGAAHALREHLYIAGLSATNYPGSPRENYLLLDTDLKEFGKEAEYMTSAGRIKRKRDTLFDLADLACALKTTVCVSYSGMNVSELKRDNASSLIYELYCKEHGQNTTVQDMEKNISKVDYFAPAISVTRKVGEAYNKGEKILLNPPDAPRNPVSVHWNLNDHYSPSTLHNYFNCPRAFMLSRILGLPEPEEDKPFEMIDAKQGGILAHALMEELANSKIGKEAFLTLSEEAFDRFIKSHPPLIEQNVEAEKIQFLDMMGTAYDMDPHRDVLFVEHELSGEHESGVKIKGILDRVEKLDDGTCLVVDFKSGSTVTHIQDDIDSCMQIVIYAYLMELSGSRVSGGEFRYIRRGETVSCKYDDEMKEQLLQKLNEFRQHLEAADFPVADNPEACKYCKFGLICGKNEEGGNGNV